MTPGLELSATQIEKFRLCRRKWAFEYIDKISTPSSPAAAFGLEGHKAIEHWLKTGTMPPAASDILKLLQKAIKPGLLPTPARELEIERRFDFKLGRHLFRGYIDCLVPPNSTATRPLIIDHKFRSDAKFMLDSEGLTNDLQANVYAFVAMLMFQVEAVDLRWLYYFSTGSPANRPKRPGGIDKVEVILYASYTERFMNDVLRDADTMAEIKFQIGSDGAKNVEPTFTSCSAFGGCPFFEKCKDGSSPTDRARAVFRQSFGLKGYETTEKNQGSEEPKPKEDEMSMLDELREKRKRLQGVNQGVNPEKNPAAVVTETETRRKILGDLGDESVKGTSTSKKLSPLDKIKKPKKNKTQISPTVTAPPLADTSSNALTLPPLTVSLDVGSNDEVEPIDLNIHTRVEKKTCLFRLFVNCYPIKSERPVKRLEEVVVAATSQVEAAFAVPHWRLIEYGRDKPSLELAFEDWLDGHLSDVECDLCMDTRTAVGTALLEMLSRKAIEVFRGIF